MKSINLDKSHPTACRAFSNITIKLLVVSFLLFICPLISQGQENPFYFPQRIPNRDSLLSIAKNSKNELQLLEAYRELGFSFYENKRDSALYYFEECVVLAKKYDRKLWEADASNSIGFISYTQGNYPRGLQFILQAKKIAENPDSEKNTWSLSDSSKVTPLVARLTILARTHLHLGSLYGFTGNFKENTKKEFTNFYAALDIANILNDKVLQSIINMNMGRHYYFAGKLDSVLYFDKIAIDFIKETGYTRYKGSTLATIGNVYAKQKKYDLAKESYRQSIQASLEIRNLRSLADAYLALSNLHRELTQIDSSLYFGKKALESYRASSLPTGIVDAYASLSSTYQLENNIDSAFRYQGLAMKAREELSADEKIKQFQNVEFDERLRVQQQGEEKKQAKTRIVTFASLAGIGVFMIIALLLFRNNRIRRKANTLLEIQKTELQRTLSELRATQSQLIQSEKMASLGELTAGIAHEIQNPLNFVNNFSEVNEELLMEMKDELDKGKIEDALVLAQNAIANQKKINHHGKRADAIVKGMLQHSRSSNGVKEPTDVNALADEYLRLSYHGLRAKDKSFNATLNTRYDETISTINIIPQDIGRVILNLINNAFYAVAEKSSYAKASADKNYEPTVSVTTKKNADNVQISVKDNGNGISQKVLDKIFQPFFTTKPTGQGTGLGLSLSYDIVKAHGGEIKVNTKENEGTEFRITLPA